jgi:hypothetical protein
MNTCYTCNTFFKCNGGCVNSNKSMNCLCFDCWCRSAISVHNYSLEQINNVINSCKWDNIIQLSKEQLEIRLVSIFL